jgi:hypothetical protein
MLKASSILPNSVEELRSTKAITDSVAEYEPNHKTPTFKLSNLKRKN